MIGKLRNDTKTTKRTHNTCVACHTTARHGRVAEWQYPGRVTSLDLLQLHCHRAAVRHRHTSAMCLCVSLLKGLPQKDAKLRNTAAIRHIYAGNSVIACFVICFVIFRKTTKPQVERFVIFSYFDRQITKRHQNYETSTLQTCHRSQKGAPLACHRAAASRPCHLATTPAACPQRGRSMPKTCAYNVCLCLSPKRFGSKYRKITKHRRNMTCLCRSQRYRVFRNLVFRFS